MYYDVESNCKGVVKEVSAVGAELKLCTGLCTQDCLLVML